MRKEGEGGKSVTLLTSTAEAGAAGAAARCTGQRSKCPDACSCSTLSCMLCFTVCTGLRDSRHPH